MACSTPPLMRRIRVTRLPARLSSSSVSRWPGGPPARAGLRPGGRACRGAGAAGRCGAGSGAPGALHAAHEALNLARRVHDALLARVERVALRADVGAQLGAGRPGGPGVAAGACHRGVHILRVEFQLSLCIFSFRSDAGAIPAPVACRYKNLPVLRTAYCVIRWTGQQLSRRWPPTRAPAPSRRRVAPSPMTAGC